MLRVPGPAEVDLWLTDPDRYRGRDSELAAQLTAEERALWQRRPVEKPKREYAVTRALVRAVLSRYAPVAPLDWRFEETGHGRPRVVAPSCPVHFNLTHTHGLVACAISPVEEIGVDAESLERGAPLEVARRFFSADELAALEGAPAPEQPERFFAIWTLKEAYLKARSKGLSLPLAQFTISLGPPPAIRFGPEIDDRPGSWQLLELQPTRTHKVALAVRAAVPLRVEQRWLDLISAR